MRESIALLLIALFSIAGVRAQETLISDQIPAFEGTISYRVRYEGPNSKKWAAFLPDSVAIMANGGNLQVLVYGGVADSLLHEFVWLAAEDMVFAVDRRSGTIWESPAEYTAKVTKAISENAAADSVAGHPVKAFKLPQEEGTIHYLVSEGIHFPVASWDSATISRPPFLAGGLQTIPLFIKQEGPITSISQAVSISQESHPIALPAGLERKPFFSRDIRHPFIQEEDR